MRALGVALGFLGITAVGWAATTPEVVILPRPSFPAAVEDVTPSGPRLELVSSVYRSPARFSFRLYPARPKWAPRRLKGERVAFTIGQGRLIFVVYGHDSSSGRYLLGGPQVGDTPSFAFDFVNFVRPPGGGWLEDVSFARQVDGVLYVENTHLTYASATRGRNAYVTAIDLRTNKILWRSPALVANAATFVMSGNLIVSGYGFTAEDDFLYLLDRRTGRVLDRLPVPSAPEVIKLRGDRLEVRTYDRKVVARIVGS